MPKNKTHSGIEEARQGDRHGKLLASAPASGTCSSTSPRTLTRRLTGTTEVVRRRRPAGEEAAGSLSPARPTSSPARSAAGPNTKESPWHA